MTYLEEFCKATGVPYMNLTTVTVYDYALSAREVAFIYQQERACFPDPDFDEWGPWLPMPKASQCCEFLNEVFADRPWGFSVRDFPADGRWHSLSEFYVRRMERPVFAISKEECPCPTCVKWRAVKTQEAQCLECAPKVRRINTCSRHGAMVPVILCRSQRRGVCVACLAEGREGGWCHTPPTPALGTTQVDHTIDEVER